MTNRAEALSEHTFRASSRESVIVVAEVSSDVGRLRGLMRVYGFN